MSEKNQTTQPKFYAKHEVSRLGSPSYEPIMPQNGLQRAIGYFLLIAVAVMSPFMALITVFWSSLMSLF